MMGCFLYFGLRLKAATLGLAVQNILSDKDLVMLLVTCVSGLVCFTEEGAARMNLSEK
jgi:hypothetical protein